MSCLKGSIFCSSLHPNSDSFRVIMSFPVLDKDACSSKMDDWSFFRRCFLGLLFYLQKAIQKLPESQTHQIVYPVPVNQQNSIIAQNSLEAGNKTI